MTMSSRGSMAREEAPTTPHFVLIPWMAQGHVIPMMDIARLLSTRQVAVTVVTTPGNAARIAGPISRLSSVRFATVSFPSLEAGLPEGCENLDSIPSRDMARNFYAAAKLLRAPLESLLRALRPKPSCIVSGIGFPWLDGLARDLDVPRIVFQGFSCFALLATHTLHRCRDHEAVATPHQPFQLPGLPHQVEITTAQLPKFFDGNSKFCDIYKELREGELSADGFIVNSFDELEPGYADCLEQETGKKAWTIGPVSLCTKDPADTAERGNKASMDERHCLAWLDSKPPSSVIYVSFGSMGRISAAQWVEMGSGLERTNRPFVWVVRPGDDEVDRWLEEDGFEARTSGKCLLIRGWAPQVMILSHEAVGGFVTHCGWNSALEGISSGLPMVTWPLGAEQFLNEKLVVEVLRIGVSVGATAMEDDGEVAVVKWEEVARAVEILMDGEDEGEERRRRARELGDMARRTIEKWGSSYNNLTGLIQYVSRYHHHHGGD